MVLFAQRLPHSEAMLGMHSCDFGFDTCCQNVKLFKEILLIFGKFVLEYPVHWFCFFFLEQKEVEGKFHM